MDAPAKLRSWLRKTRTSQYRLAASMGLTPAIVTLWLRGDRTPTLRHALQIQQASGGAVPAHAWFPGLPFIDLHPTGCPCRECRKAVD